MNNFHLNIDQFFHSTQIDTMNYIFLINNYTFLFLPKIYHYGNISEVHLEEIKIYTMQVVHQKIV